MFNNKNERAKQVYNNYLINKGKENLATGQLLRKQQTVPCGPKVAPPKANELSFHNSFGKVDDQYIEALETQQNKFIL